jgi:hypothetical protein
MSEYLVGDRGTNIVLSATDRSNFAAASTFASEKHTRFVVGMLS